MHAFLTGVVNSMHVYACTLDRCCVHQYTFANTLATGCAYALMYVQFVHLALGNEDGGV